MARVRYIGDLPDITFRGVVFPQGKAVVVDDADLVAKVLNLDYFERVKVGRKPKNGEDRNRDRDGSAAADQRGVVEGDGIDG